MGGDEFVVLMERSGGTDALVAIAEAALAAVREPVYLRGHEISVAAARPGAGARRSGPLRGPRRGGRAHRGARALGAGGGVPAGGVLAAAAAERQPRARAGPRAGDRAADSRRARRDRAAAGVVAA